MGSACGWLASIAVPLSASGAVAGCAAAEGLIAELAARGCGVFAPGVESTLLWAPRWPMAYPSPKQSPQRRTRPKKMASSVPDPSVSSVSRRALTGSSSLSSKTPLIYRLCHHCFRRSRQDFGVSAGLAPASLFISVKNSIGSGKTMVVFFSTPMSASVCR
jgi:hypothetical protein